jgi:hypothetical protein
VRLDCIPRCRWIACANRFRDRSVLLTHLLRECLRRRLVTTRYNDASFKVLPKKSERFLKIWIGRHRNDRLMERDILGDPVKTSLDSFIYRLQGRFDMNHISLSPSPRSYRCGFGLDRATEREKLQH